VAQKRERWVGRQMGDSVERKVGKDRDGWLGREKDG
jgi:hypothetical protein